MTAFARLYIVEDEALIALELRDRLTLLGYEISGMAASGEKAVDEIVALRPDLVLMDIRLAGAIDGIETARRCQQVFDVAVVFLTAHADEPELQRATGVRPFGYLLKPFQERELNATIVTALERMRLQRAVHEANARLEATVEERTAQYRDANARLQASEARYVTLALAMSDLVFVLDAEDRFLDAHFPSESLLALPTDTFVNRRLDEVMPAAVSAAYFDCLERVQRTRRRGRFEYDLEVQGERRRFLASLEPPAADGRRVLGIVDITERHAAQEALRLSEENLRITLRSIGDAVVATDADRRVTHMNPVAERLTGWSVADARGLDVDAVLQLFDAQTAATVPAPVDAVLRTGEIHALSRHTMLRARDGRALPIADSAAPLRAADGSVTGVVFVFRDVTDERATEHERSQRLSFFSTINEITLDLLARRHHDELLPQVVRRSAELFDAQHVDVLLIENDALVARASVEPVNPSIPDRRARLPRGVGLAWRAVDGREPLVLTDYSAHPDRRRGLEELGLHATAFIPIVLGAKCLGVLFLSRNVANRPFSPTEVAAGRLFAQLIAVMLHRASLFEDAVQRADRKTAELRTSESLFEAMALAVPTGLFRTSATGGMEYVNPQFCRMAGLAADECMGAGWTSALHPEERARMQRLVARSLQHVVPLHLEARYLRPDGTVGWFEANAVPWRGEDGTMRGFVGSVDDITQRRRIETMLHALSEESVGLGVDAYLQLCVQRLAETLGIAVAYVARYQERAGSSMQTLAVWMHGAPAENFTYPAEGTPCAEAVARREPFVIGSGLRERFPHLAFLKATGADAYVGCPLLDHEGEVWGLLAVMDPRPLTFDASPVQELLQLVAVRISVELERRRVEGRFNSLFEYAPDATLMTDERGRIVLVNRRTADLFGYTPAELIGQPVEMLIPPAKRDAHAEARAQYGAESKPHPRYDRRAGLVGQRKDGSVFPADVSLSPMEGERGALVVATVRDITAQVRAEEALRQRDAILAGVAFAASRMLAAAQWQDEMPAILARIGESARASHALLLQRSEGAGSGAALVKRFGWSTPCAPSATADADPVSVVFQAEGTARVQQALQAGEALVVAALGATAPVRAMLDAQGVRSVALVPIGSGGRSWGALALDRCAADDAWSPMELDALSAAASVIGAALERERVDAALREGEERLRMVVDHIGEGLIVDDAAGNVTFYNDRFAEIFGFRRQDGLAIRLEDYVAPEQRALLRARHEHRMRGLPVPTQFEYQGIRATGERIWLDVHAVEIRDAHGRIAGTQSSIRDITARKQADLQISEALATLDATADAAYILDPRTLRFLYVNQGAVRTLGYSRTELLGMTAMDIEMAASEAALRTLIAPLMEDNGAAPRRIETRHRRKDGSTVPVEVTLQFVRLSQGSERIIALARDITERLTRQATERRAQRLEAIGTLAGGIAHDLNNALTPILMGLELLREEQPGRSRTVDQVAIGVERATSMVRQLLGFARGAEGERTTIHPVRLVGEMHRLIASTFPKNIEVHVRCDEDAPSVNGDATQLHQVLLNLCVNARDAMPHGGALMLEASSIELGADQARGLPGAQPGKFLRLVVQDTGAGIPEHLLDRIFDPFFTTKESDGGTGLGLSTALGIVRGHNGFILVESEPERRTTFEVYLPSNEAAGAVPGVSIAPTSAFRGRGEMVLFVDDERLVREMATIVLERLNFVPLTAADGTEALQTLAERGSQIYAVVTDLHMPRLDGVGFVRALRQTHPKLPVAVASGRLDDAQAAELESLGVTTRLDKPFTQARLADTLKRLLER